MSEARSDDLDPVSEFFAAERERLRAVAPLGPVLDLACGRGRHAIAAAELGCRVLAIDRNAESLRELAARPVPPPGRIDVLEADLEGPSPPRLEAAPFAAVLVFRYLHRPLAPYLEELLAPGALLFYETFTTDQRELGWGPGRDDFLLMPGELPSLFPGLEVVSFSEGMTTERKPASTARLVARKPRG